MKFTSTIELRIVRCGILENVENKRISCRIIFSYEPMVQDALLIQQTFLQQMAVDTRIICVRVMEETQWWEGTAAWIYITELDINGQVPIGVDSETHRRYPV